MTLIITVRDIQIRVIKHKNSCVSCVISNQVSIPTTNYYHVYIDDKIMICSVDITHSVLEEVKSELLEPTFKMAECNTNGVTMLYCI